MTPFSFSRIFNSGSGAKMLWHKQGANTFSHDAFAASGSGADSSAPSLYSSDRFGRRSSAFVALTACFALFFAASCGGASEPSNQDNNSEGPTATVEAETSEEQTTPDTESNDAGTQDAGTQGSSEDSEPAKTDPADSKPAETAEIELICPDGFEGPTDGKCFFNLNAHLDYEPYDCFPPYQPFQGQCKAVNPFSSIDEAPAWTTNNDAVQAAEGDAEHVEWECPLRPAGTEDTWEQENDFQYQRTNVCYYTPDPAPVRSYVCPYGAEGSPSEQDPFCKWYRPAKPKE